MKTQMTATAVTLGQIQQQLATVADNLANTGTVGYKSRGTTFEDLLFQQVNNIGATEDPLDQANRLTPDGLRSGSGSRVGDTYLDLTTGALRQTDNDLDLALTDDHQFFQIGYTDAGGQAATAYTRDGAFRTLPDPQNPNVLRLLTQEGASVLDRDGLPIYLPSGYKEVQINREGLVTALMPDGQAIAAGQLGIVRVNRPQLLEDRGDNLYVLPNPLPAGIDDAQVVQQADNGSVVQGKLEEANVDVTDEMMNLIDLQRAYQLNARSITMGDQMAGLVNGLLRV